MLADSSSTESSIFPVSSYGFESDTGSDIEESNEIIIVTL